MGMKSTVLACNSSRNKYIEKQREVLAELSELMTFISKDGSVNFHSGEWCSFEFKKGKIATLREQKAQSLRNQKCVACGSRIQNFSSMLSSIDRQIINVESELHVHNEASESS